MNPTLIDLNDYLLSGEGANGQSFDCKSDNNIMVKLYNPNYDTNCILTELDTAQKVYSLGIPSPKPGELVTDGKRIGIKFNRVIGKRSYARAFSQEPERVPELSREFARYCKKLHATECPEGLFPDVRQEYLRLLDADTVFSPALRQKVREFIIDGIPQGTTALHGDLHFGNVLTTLPKGAAIDTPHEVLFIDLGYFSRGCPLIDLGMTYQICTQSDEEFLKHDFHFDRSIALIAWDNFVKEYFSGSDKTINQIEDEIKPYAMLKFLLVEYNLGFLPDHYKPFVINQAERL